jgi:hypothetical protein
MSDGAVLAELARQASVRGADMTELRAMIEEAGELGARRALTRLGLGDDDATGDVAALRELLRAWRDAKRSALKAAMGWVVRMILALVLVSIGARLGWGK